MKYITIGIFICVILLLFIIFEYIDEEYDIIEGIRGDRDGRRGDRIRRRQLNRGSRRWYGGNWGYRYRPPPPRVRYYPEYYPQYYPQYIPRYIPWLSSGYWFGNICKNGCTNVGNNVWGCQFPGGGPNDCIFASDCYGCG